MNNFHEEIKKIQTKDCPQSLIDVIDRFTPVFLSMYSKYSSSILKSGADPNDILLDKYLIIYESAKSFNLEKGSSFCTWLSNNVKYKCLHLMNKTRKTQMLQERLRDNRELLSDEKNPTKLKELNSSLFLELDRMKDKRIKEVYKLRYFSGGKKTWDFIGKSMGFSSQTAINLHRRGAEILKRKVFNK